MPVNLIGVGVSEETNPDLAIAEVLNSAVKQAGLPQVDWILVFFTLEHFVHAGRLHELIQEQTNCKCIAGCSGMGVISGVGEIFGGPGLVLMAGYTPELKMLALAKFQELEHSSGVSQQLREALSGFNDQSPLFFFFPDIYQHLPQNFINMFNFLKNQPSVFGAGSCNDGSQETSIQFGPDIVTLNGAGGLAFTGVPEFHAGVTQSCATLGDPMFVTEVKDDLILTLDGKPALEVFTEVAKELGFADMEQATQQLLLSFPLDREQPVFTGEGAMASHVTGIDMVSQGIRTTQIVHQGGVVSFTYRSHSTAEDDLRKMLSRLKNKNAETPTWGLYFNCSSRGEALYGRSNVDTEIIREMLGEFPLIGFFGGYEFAQMPQGVQLYTYTGVLVLVYL
ncbi:MAG: FIST C-terminal domain-containing protein [SAR324 cluster bacterium]|nr:FIST C-terminal domain-containing protein [SAR324 cluster bacterium]MBL7034297.1 FIST C-terminal domain-containing protein [SAR324 cluster bacterium]